MTDALDRFERELWKAESLNYALQYVTEHEAEKRSQLAKAVAEGREVRFRDFREYQKAVLDAVTVGSLALFWRGFETYCRIVLGISDCIDSIRERRPRFMAQCHRNHPSAHVLTILRDVRDRELHSLRRYNVISCDRLPDEITLQPAVVRESETETQVLLFHDLNVEQQRAWLEAGPVSRTRNDFTTLGEFLVEEARDCVKEFDFLADSTGGLRRGKRMPSRKPVRFPPPPGSVLPT